MFREWPSIFIIWTSFQRNHALSANFAWQYPWVSAAVAMEKGPGRGAKRAVANSKLFQVGTNKQKKERSPQLLISSRNEKWIYINATAVYYQFYRILGQNASWEMSHLLFCTQAGTLTFKSKNKIFFNADGELLYWWFNQKSFMPI